MNINNNMKIYEIISEASRPAIISIRDAKKILSKLGYSPTGRQSGSHDIWKDANGVLFAIPTHGKSLEYGITTQLYQLARSRGLKI